MQLKRASGILLHPTSLPGSPGIGTIGKNAFDFIDWLSEANQTLWQILPSGPTGYGDSPYASFSTFAGNPLLIDLDILVKEGVLDKDQASPPEYIRTNGNVDFGSVVYWKKPLLKTAAVQFLTRADLKTKRNYELFKAENAFWLDTYAVFMSIKEIYDAKAQKEGVANSMWNAYWPEELKKCNADAVEKWQKDYETDCEIQKAIQYFYFSQWNALKKYANGKGISIIGDIPIFVASDSADVWANQKLFRLTPESLPEFVAGVPPDYFSADGQLWGNPLYNWDEMKKDGYSWWIDRIKTVLKQTDYVRIDHFRGFDEYWSVPYGQKTAVHGKWVKGPAYDFFNAVKSALGDIQIIAEDLGIITDSVRKLRDHFCLPGMKILEFAFDKNEAAQGAMTNAFLPHTYDKNCVVYTGTHDNDTVQGWLEKLPLEDKRLIAAYLGFSEGEAQKRCADGELCRELVRAALASVANWAIIPLQDVYSLGTEARMNMPSTAGGTNWQWRMGEDLLDKEKALWLKKCSVLYARNVL
ncbi:4-alpha-glucanotransferase [Treponema parvum]|uniref:4-alpha-glucanotransferase n=1 Tax=Treponema parvum TaxID=138851 RepID=A0A975IDS4_9SPIR|nr:4-alpha-glucanotransferase [Treponema parvum]QTQ13122.1 4-alpha-glucanotransferase [Treponema parvum]